MNRFVIATLVVVAILAGCSSAGPAATPSSTATATPAATPTTASPSNQANAFPTAAFADISEDPVSAAVAAELQMILTEIAGGADMAATVMSVDGTWSGATGKADGVRDVRVEDQFAIASVTKTLVAAQVMQMVEAGDLRLDDPAADYLPPDLDFDTNGATIRQLLGMRSGIPEYGMDAERRLEMDEITPELLRRADPQRHWTPVELLEQVSADRTPRR